MKLPAFLFLVISSLVLFAFTSPIETTGPSLDGTWNLTIDKKIDGKISGNLGCTEMVFKQSGNSFSGKYTKCQAASQNAMPAKFSGKILSSSRGTLIQITMDNYASTKYYATFAGQLIDGEMIEGIWTDVEGNQGEFRLSR